ncbi:MAG: methylenetetrahydrofolate reductase [NAD(P)H] [Candidatus Margulisbacteria bacterium]|nr:methylenetetrahydrofolate reductase [NAD(P)H] [Candidatus Margulisiibacteriota bacterium]
MKVIDLLNSGKQTLSFEFFPPKTLEQEEHLFAVINQLKAFSPDYVSVTYGALGANQEKSFQWVGRLKNEFKIEPVAHLTCVGDDREGIRRKLKDLEEIGVGNILALRGDPPAGEIKFSSPPNGFKHASELVDFIKREMPEVCIGVAGYPEKHPEAKSIDEDIMNLKTKVDAGADYIVTQLFFDNQKYFAFVDKCRKAGITVPIVPGIMPIISYKSIFKMTQTCGANLPSDLLAKLEKHKDNRVAIQAIGVEQAVNQCRELRLQKVPGMHFFVMNQAGQISRILGGRH